MCITVNKMSQKMPDMRKLFTTDHRMILKVS